jgi:Fe-S-cluster-containing dehydrogenase component
VSACRETNAALYPEPRKPFPAMFPARVKAEDFSDRRDVDDRLTPYNWLFIQTARGEHQGQPFEVNIPRRCLHCQNPPCAKLCPWGAMGRDADGSVRVATDICLGGAKCRQVCPWHIPQRQTGVGLYLKLMPAYGGNGVMYKCHRCKERMALGELPACIEACPNQVQSIGPRPEMAEKAKALAASMNGHVYGLTENGGTNTFYVSPVPFPVLDQALAAGKQTGPGKPHLKAVPEALATEGRLAALPFLAAFTGVARAGLSVARRLPDRPWVPGGPAKAASPAVAPAHPLSRGQRRLFLALMAGLSLTGMAQMPIFKRYYIADIPGLGWLDDFYLVHVLHYALAVPLLFLLGLWAVRWLREWRGTFALTALAPARAALLAGLAVSGLVRVAKNLPVNPLGPTAAMLVDWVHLGLAALLGLTALAAVLAGGSAYVRARKRG